MTGHQSSKPSNWVKPLWLLSPEFLTPVIAGAGVWPGAWCPAVPSAVVKTNQKSFSARNVLTCTLTVWSFLRINVPRKLILRYSFISTTYSFWCIFRTEGFCLSCILVMRERDSFSLIISINWLQLVFPRVLWFPIKVLLIQYTRHTLPLRRIAPAIEWCEDVSSS